MKSKLLHIWYDMRHQPVIGWVTLIATALSIFLIMVVLIMQRVKVVPFAPESCRERLLVAPFIHIKDNTGGDSSGSMSYTTAQMLYEGLEGVERISYIKYWCDREEIKKVHDTAHDGLVREVDGEFFNIFDHTLLEGRYFTLEESQAEMPVAVITESIARDVLGNQKWTGSEILINQHLYTVVGVIRDHSGLATLAAGDAFVPPSYEPWEGGSGHFGPLGVVLLMKEGVTDDDIRSQVKARYAEFDTQLAPSGEETVYHESPFTQETIVTTDFFGSNTTPDSESGRNMRLIIYTLLLLVPAINLSSMLHSRMRQRINEIGVQRAFGCTRTRVITDILTENFIVTLAGGIVGVTLGIIFATTYSGLYENMDNIGHAPTPALSATLNWGTVVIAVGVCFLLNLISASIPAWQASRMNPVEAINKK